MLLHGADFRRPAKLAQLLLCLIMFTACTGGIPVINSGTPGPTKTRGPIDYPKTEVVFHAQLASPLGEGDHLVIEFLDEVTGLGFHSAHARMEAVDPLHYTLTIPVVVGSVLKYRYILDITPAEIEYTSENQQVRYRMAVVSGPGVVEDIVAGWKDDAAPGSVGRIHGQISYKDSNAPVVNALVAAGGMQTLTASDGSFVLEDLPPGLHNLVVYSMDGAFQPFQQGALIGPESTTPASIQVDASRIVNVTFTVTPPADNMRGIPIRVIGNISSLGNTFADLHGGVNTLASRAPFMEMLPDGRYNLTMQLPVGMDLRYKYTLGDGLWNSERATDGSIQLRQLIVPGRDVTVEDSIATWKSGDIAPISFLVTVPSSTPVTDTISIQFNPFDWTEPIPMWSLGNQQWIYVLFNPLDALERTNYRFCRNDQCGLADPASGSGTPLHPGTEEQRVVETIENWAWLTDESEPIVVPNTQILAREARFMAGVALLPGYHPSWQPYVGSAIQNIRDIGSNTIVISPTWHATHISPPVLEPVPGHDALWPDLMGMAVPAQQKGLRLILHPTLQYSGGAQNWWQSAPRDTGWWQTWFDRYHAFMITNADMAAQTGAEVLILGDESLSAALPGGVLPDGTPSSAPAEMEARWRSLIGEIRARYTGKLAWFVPLTGSQPSVPVFAADLDLLYVQMSPPFVSNDTASPVDLQAQIAALLDGYLLPLQQQTGHPVLLAVQSPSARGAQDGCVDDPSGGCVAAESLLQPAVTQAGLAVALEDQANVYSAALAVINDRPWISGFLAVGYYPPVELQDASISIRGKPANHVLWYWYPRLTGQANP